jgi:chemotaxis protein MotA
MNVTALGGILAVNIVFFASVFIALGDFVTFYDGPSVLIVFGGTISSLFVFVPMKDLKLMVGSLKGQAFSTSTFNYAQSVEDVISLAQERRKGESAYDAAVKKVRSPFLQDAASILFWTDSEVSGDEFRDLLETRANTYFKAGTETPKLMNTLAKFPPAFGMMGTVLGLVALLQSLSSPDAKSQIGPAMAVALMTTLYGIMVNNLFITPVSENLSKRHGDMLREYDLIVEGIMLIQQNKPTKYIEEKLNSYLMPEERPS